MNKDSAHGSTEPHIIQQPLQLLREEHEFVRQLFLRFFSTHDPRLKQELGPRILTMLEMHAALEEATFYPAVRRLDDALIDLANSEHEAADHLIQQLKELDSTHPQYERLFEQLQEVVMRHIESEETALFPLVQQSDLDLEQIALEMQAFEYTMIGLHAQRATRHGAPRNT